jgi:hypothetical protein
MIIPGSVEDMNRDMYHDCHFLREVVFEQNRSLKNLADFAKYPQSLRIEVGESFPFLGTISSLGLVLVRRKTNDWSFLISQTERVCYLIDEPLSEFAKIPNFVVDGDRRLGVSMISDRLACLCASRCIDIPKFITRIGSCHRPISSCVRRLEISSSIERIEGFLEVSGLESVIFCGASHLREIHGFCLCVSLSRVDFPSSIEIIDGFDQCDSLSEVYFEAESQLRRVCGFRSCGLLTNIEIPVSVESVIGFDRCLRLERFFFQGVR